MAADKADEARDQQVEPAGQKAASGDRPEVPAGAWRLVSEADQFSLSLLRTNWGLSYAINFDGTDWTASPRESPETVITHQDPLHLGTLISLDYTRRTLLLGRARHDDTWYREGFSSST